MYTHTHTQHYTVISMVAWGIFPQCVFVEDHIACSRAVVENATRSGDSRPSGLRVIGIDVAMKWRLILGNLRMTL